MALVLIKETDWRPKTRPNAPPQQPPIGTDAPRYRAGVNPTPDRVIPHSWLARAGIRAPGNHPVTARVVPSGPERSRVESRQSLSCWIHDHSGPLGSVQTSIGVASEHRWSGATGQPARSHRFVTMGSAVQHSAAPR